MLKSTVIIFFVLYGSEVKGFPSVNNEAIVTSKGPTGEELKRLIQETISQNLNDRFPTTTNTPVANRISQEVIADVAKPWQLNAAQNLTTALEDLAKTISNLTPPSTTPAPATAYNERFENIERTLRYLTESFKKLAPVEEQLTASTQVPLICGYVSGYEYSSETNRCYKLHKGEVNWIAANEACSAEKAYLAVINNREEARYLADVGRRISKNLHIGVYKDSASQWMTVTGETMEIAAGYKELWSSGEPYIGGQWRVATINSEGTLDSRYESSTYPFICEKAP